MTVRWVTVWLAILAVVACELLNHTSDHLLVYSAPTCRQPLHQTLPYLRLATSEMWCWYEGRGILKEKLSLCTLFTARCLCPVWAYYAYERRRRCQEDPVSPSQRTVEDNQLVVVSRGSAPSNRIWNNTTLRSLKQQIWLRTAVCGGWCRRMALCSIKSCVPEMTMTTSIVVQWSVLSTHSMCPKRFSLLFLITRLILAYYPRQNRKWLLNWLYACVHVLRERGLTPSCTVVQGGDWCWVLGW